MFIYIYVCLFILLKNLLENKSFNDKLILLFPFSIAIELLRVGFPYRIAFLLVFVNSFNAVLFRPRRSSYNSAI